MHSAAKYQDTRLGSVAGSHKEACQLPGGSNERPGNSRAGSAGWHAAGPGGVGRGGRPGGAGGICLPAPRRSERLHRSPSTYHRCPRSTRDSSPVCRPRAISGSRAALPAASDLIYHVLMWPVSTNLFLRHNLQFHQHTYCRSRQTTANPRWFVCEPFVFSVHGFHL